MMRKIIYGVMGGVVLLAFGAFLGLIIGAFIGGNYMTEFEFSGVRGYEAVGRIGAYIGAAVGALLSILLWMKLAKDKIPHLFRIIIVVVFIIVTFFIAAFFLISDRPSEKVTLEQAQMGAGFTIYEPAYLPEGVELSAIRWMNEGSKDTLFLSYMKENKQAFDLIEAKLTEPPKGQDSVEIDSYFRSFTNTQVAHS